VAYAVAILLRREPGCHPFTSIDAQSVSLNTLRVFVFALTPAIRYLKAFLKELVSLRLARACVSLKKAGPLRASDRKDSTPQLRQEAVALRIAISATTAQGSTSVIRRCLINIRITPQADLSAHHGMSQTCQELNT